MITIQLNWIQKLKMMDCDKFSSINTLIFTMCNLIVSHTFFLAVSVFGNVTQWNSSSAWLGWSGSRVIISTSIGLAHIFSKSTVKFAGSFVLWQNDRWSTWYHSPSATSEWPPTHCFFILFMIQRKPFFTTGSDVFLFMINIVLIAPQWVGSMVHRGSRRNEFKSWSSSTECLTSWIVKSARKLAQSICS